MGEGIITILTPTFNRGDCLSQLFNSLLGQRDRRFDWLVVDDGSEDNTEEIVNGFIRHVKERGARENNDIKIRYVRKDNGGKHTAINEGLKLVSTPLVMIVDSDDSLTEDAVETIIGFYEQYRDKKIRLNLCGFSFLRADSRGNINGGLYPEDESVGNLVERRINAGIWGDRAEVYFTDILKKYPFPVFENERFVPEDGVWVRMSGPHSFVHANRVVYICDYLEGGLTNTGRKMKIFSPLGMMYRSASYLRDRSVRFKVRLKMLMLYRIYERFAVDKEIPDSCRIKKGILYELCGPPSYFFYIRWK